MTSFLNQSLGSGLTIDLCFEHVKAKTAVAPLDRVKILFQASNPDYLKYSGEYAPGTLFPHCYRSLT